MLHLYTLYHYENQIMIIVIMIMIVAIFGLGNLAIIKNKRYS